MTCTATTSERIGVYCNNTFSRNYTFGNSPKHQEMLFPTRYESLVLKISFHGFGN